MDTTVTHRLYTLYVTKYQHALSFNQPKRTMYDTNIIYNENKHISDRMLYVLKLLNLPTNTYQYTVNFPEAIKSKVKNFIAQTIPNKLIILNPFASEKIHCLSNK
ncbi:hypothetical protein [Candidatus Schmidhempelia bombi]|uniref:Uncharacterized protein n=1 Tax=Candidatus Schmidhempelia bombi str. Bimp TaxID=1387197 RepID=A0AB94IEC2_9GAMM|nr:hypothetical protein [Candidatus Schmidhempelia bombi]TEA27814.1 hypothetical protein O970_01775 [Candidatus Schmidhempelia bombi str. Bimp]